MPGLARHPRQPRWQRRAAQEVVVHQRELPLPPFVAERFHLLIELLVGLSIQSPDETGQGRLAEREEEWDGGARRAKEGAVEEEDGELEDDGQGEH